jgi:PBSX family phage terminase large subunit
MSSTDAGPNLLEPTDERFRHDPVNVTLEPHPLQEPFLSGDERYHAFVSGVGAGKTVGGIYRALLNAQYWNPGETGMIVAPTVPALRNAVVQELHKWNVLNLCEYKASEKSLEFPNGSRIILESADNNRKIERLRGPSIAWFWMDEAAIISDRAWKILIGRLREGSYRNAAITTTPKGFNWVYDRFADDEAVNRVLGVRTEDNPHLPDDYASEIVQEYEGRFYDQEVLGEFVRFEGLVYDWFDRETHLVDERPDTYDEVIYGVDWGFSNPAVTLVIYREGDRWTLVDEWYERRCTDDDHADATLELIEQYGEGVVYCDPSEPSNIETFRRNGINAKGAENPITPGIQHVTSLQDEFRAHRDCQAVINEFGQYQYPDGKRGEKPVDENNHAMDALRYALFTHQHGPPGTAVETARTNINR